MAKIKYYFSRSFFLILLASLAGFLFPQAAAVTSFFILPLLTIALSLTLLRLPRGFFRKPLSLISPALWGVAMTYLLLGNVIILSGIFLIRDDSLWMGLLLIAAAPPAIAVIPMTDLLKIDMKAAIAGFAGGYAGALLIIPLIALGFLKYVNYNYYDLFLLVLCLIVLPLLVSRIAVDRDWDAIVEPYESIVTDCCFLVIFYTMVASNSIFILQRFLELSLILVIALISTFFLGFAINKIGGFLRVPRSRLDALLILGTMKNNILVGGIALIIFKHEAALPAIIFTLISCVYSIWLRYWSNKRQNPTLPQTDKAEDEKQAAEI